MQRLLLHAASQQPDLAAHIKHTYTKLAFAGGVHASPVEKSEILDFSGCVVDVEDRLNPKKVFTRLKQVYTASAAILEEISRIGEEAGMQTQQFRSQALGA
jgi:hypothetical protein